MAITAGRLRARAEVVGRAHAIAALAGRAAELAADGVDFILIREKNLLAAEDRQTLSLLCAAVKAAAAGTRCQVLLAGPAALAAELGLAGVHVGSQGDVSAARQMFPAKWVTASCHKLAEVSRARAAGVDAVLYAPVFGKWVDGVEVVPGVGLERLRQACVAAGEMPVLALGGVDPENAAACVAAGAAGVAAIRMFFSEPM